MDFVEKRKVYRVPYRSMAGREVSIVLETGTGDRFDAEIVDLSIKGVGIRFSGERLPELDNREGVAIEITLSGYEKPLRIPATTRSIFKEPGKRRYGFEFRSGRFPSKGLTSRVYAWFNRRRSPRAVPTEGVEVHLARFGLDPIKGSLVDICSEGATAELPRSEGRMLEVGDTITASFALSPNAPPVPRVARIAFRETEGRLMKAVLEFEGPEDPEAKDQIDRFVVEHLLAQDLSQD